MIRNVMIIKDGLPLLSHNFCNSKNPFSKTNNLIMISGFFSALNSFSDQFNELGAIHELKLSKNNYKLSFLKDKNIPNLIYLASFDDNSKSVDVHNTLKKISNTFLKNFNINQIMNWSGRLDAFKSFEAMINDCVEKEGEKDIQKTRIDKLIPMLKVSKSINPKNYLSGDRAMKVFNLIDGTKSINEISNLCSISTEKVYNICKILIKFGFISYV
ncbi:MAG: hypothetical protein GF353_27650 [Candidatus Lokiarchaeota archaeon]|nr:hypothetical protein [Candidatus Lokiarchaeota archaeon]